MCLLLCNEEGSYPVSAITDRDMGLYEVPVSVSLLGLGMRTMLANLVRYYIVVKSSFKHTREDSRNTYSSTQTCR